MAEIGDPTMIVLPSTQQYANVYTFATTSHSRTSGYQNYLVLVAPTNQIEGLIYDGKV